MRIGSVLVPKYVVALNSLLLAIIVLVSVGCGNKKKSPPPPCAAGVNQVSCGLNIKGHTSWATQLSTSTLDERTRQPVPGSERKITVTYEFMEASPAPQWRRTIVVEAVDGNRGMYQQGTVRNVTGNQIDFVMEQSTCDDYNGLRFPNSDFTLFYRRSGGHLQLDTQPIEVKRARGLGDAIGNLMADMIGDGLRALLEQVFTFGSARNFLTSGRGSFSTVADTSLKQIKNKRVELGCFSTFGTGYAKSEMKPSW